MSGTFGTYSWSPRSRTGYEVVSTLERTIHGVPYIISGSDRPRRYWNGTLPHLLDSDWTTIWSLWTTNLGTFEQDSFTLTDPWLDESFTVIFSAPPTRVTDRFGYWTVSVQMLEAAAATRAKPSVTSYPTIGQARGSREISLAAPEIRKAFYGGPVAVNFNTQASRQFEIIHEPILSADLATLMEHYEGKWDESFTLGEFDATGETSITARYARPPEISQVAGAFRVSNLLEEF